MMSAAEEKSGVFRAVALELPLDAEGYERHAGRLRRYFARAQRRDLWWLLDSATRGALLDLGDRRELLNALRVSVEVEDIKEHHVAVAWAQQWV